MAQETVEKAAKDYLQDLECCRVPNPKACFYGTCASCCVTGLMIQQVNRKSVEKKDAGFCGCCYFEGCYPCVITDDCCIYSACFAILSVLPCLAILNVFQFCTNWTVRRELIQKASDKRPGCFSTTFHVLCPLCYCTPCNDAEYVMLIKQAQKTATAAVSDLVF